MVKIKRYQRDLKTNDFSFERKYPYYIKNLIKLQLGYVDIIMSLAYFDFENILPIYQVGAIVALSYIAKVYWNSWY